MKFLMGVLIVWGMNLEAKTYVSDGVYETQDCFIKADTKNNLKLFQFAHKIQHQFEDIPYSDFTPEKVLGTNIIIDQLTNRIEFGPSMCGNGTQVSYKLKWREGHYTIKCRNYENGIRAIFQMKYSYGEVESISFKEYGRNQTYFDFKCEGMGRVDI